MSFGMSKVLLPVVPQPAASPGLGGRGGGEINTEHVGETVPACHCVLLASSSAPSLVPLLFIGRFAEEHSTSLLPGKQRAERDK